MKSSSVLVAALFCLAVAPSMGQDVGAGGHTSIPAKEFVEKAGMGGLAEVEMGKLGAEKASNGQIKALSKRIVEDHTRANNELAAVTKGKGLQIPAARDPMHKAMMEKFREQEAGKDFDREYVSQMIDDHEAAIELFETAADDAKLDADLRSYAKKNLPALREHLKQAQTIESKLTN